ncbi:MAG TPA: sigma-70 family RNA polymerase sigma factor [Solirubrobacterales bacterium]
MPPPAEGLASRLILGPALRTQPDRRLVTLVREGYEAAFEEIVRRYGRALTRYAAGIVGSRSEDVTQDAFSKALLALRRDDAEIDLRPWLYRIVRNTALNDLRDNPPPPEVVAGAIAMGRSAAEEAEQREELTELIERLGALPQPQRAAIVMRELEGLSHDEIAANLGMSGGAARQAIYRARQALRDGIGMLIPLPLLRLLSDHGPGSTVGAGAGGAIAAGGAGSVLKAGAVAAVLVGTVGTGIALQSGGGGSEPPPGAEAATSATPESLSPRSAIAPRGGRADTGGSRGGRRDGGPQPRDAIPAAGDAGGRMAPGSIGPRPAPARQPPGGNADGGIPGTDSTRDGEGGPGSLTDRRIRPPQGDGATDFSRAGSGGSGGGSADPVSGDRATQPPPPPPDEEPTVDARSDSDSTSGFDSPGDTRATR